MKSIFSTALLFIIIIISGCTKVAKLEQTVKMFEEPDTDKVAKAVKDTLVELGYSLDKATLTKTISAESDATGGKKSIYYKYGAALKEGGDKSYISAAIVGFSIPEGKSGVHVVSFSPRNFSFSTMRNLLKMESENEVEENVYNEFFKVLSKKLGREALPLYPTVTPTL